jgi:hypothetical protein
MSQDLYDGFVYWLSLTVMGCVGYAIGVVDWNRLAGRFTAWFIRRWQETQPRRQGVCLDDIDWGEIQEHQKGLLKNIRSSPSETLGYFHKPKGRDDWPNIIE